MNSNNIFRRRVWQAAALAVAAASIGSAAFAQTYPNRAIRFIVPYSAGGLPDTVARIYAQRLGDRLGQPVVVDNKPGANGVVAAQAMAASPKDGYTFLVTDGSMFSINPSLYKTISYDYKRDFVPVSLAARAPLYLAVHPKTPANNLRELIALAKAKPGTLTYGSSGIGHAPSEHGSDESGFVVGHHAHSIQRHWPIRTCVDWWSSRHVVFCLAIPVWLCEVGSGALGRQ